MKRYIIKADSSLTKHTTDSRAEAYDFIDDLEERDADNDDYTEGYYSIYDTIKKKNIPVFNGSLSQANLIVSFY